MKWILSFLAVMLASLTFSSTQDKKPDPKPEAEVKVPVWNGWKLSQFRDKKIGDQKYFQPAKFKTAAAAPAFDLRKQMPPIYNQGSLGSCVANGVAGAYQFQALRQKNPNPFMPSRLYDYWFTRYIEGTVNQDSGSSIEDGVAAVAKYGTIPESEWPYDVSQFKVKPTPQMQIDARPNMITDYARCPDNSAPDIKAAIQSGNPVIIGFDVYQNFPNDASTGGVVPMPAGSVQGGHCVVLVGWDDDGSLGHKGYYVFRNSWGTTWGDLGYGYFPRAFIESNKYSSDYWIIASVPGGVDPTPPPPPVPNLFDIGINITAKSVTVPKGWKAYRAPKKQTYITTDPVSSSVVVPNGWTVRNPASGFEGAKAIPWGDIFTKVEELLEKFGPAAVPIITALVDASPLPEFLKWEIDYLVQKWLNNAAPQKKAG